MDRVRLKLVLEELREEYEREWRSVENTLLKHLDEAREIAVQRFKNNKEIDFETAKEIYEKIETAINFTKPFLFWVSPSDSGFERDKNREIESVRRKILNNQVIRKFLGEVENLESLENIYKIMKSIKKVRYSKEVSGIGLANLSTWMSIFNPKIFMPTWENTVNKHLRKDLGVV